MAGLTLSGPDRHRGTTALWEACGRPHLGQVDLTALGSGLRGSRQPGAPRRRAVPPLRPWWT